MWYGDVSIVRAYDTTSTTCVPLNEPARGSMMSTAEVDAAMSSNNNIEEEEAGGDSQPECEPEFLTHLKPEDDAPPSAPLVTGPVKQEESMFDTSMIHLSNEFKAPASGLKKDICQEVNSAMPLDRKELKEDYERDDNDGIPPGWEADTVKDGGFESCNDLSTISGVECRTLMEGSLDLSSGRNEEKKVNVSSEVTVTELIVDKVSVEEKLLSDDDRAPPGLKAANAAKDEVNNVAAVFPELTASENDDGPPPGWGETVINNDGKTMLHASVESTGAENDGAPPGWGATTINDEGKPTPLAPVDTIAFEINTVKVHGIKDELSAPDFENDVVNGPPPGLELVINNVEVDSMPPVLVESTHLEVKMEEVQHTKDELAAPDLKNDVDEPPAGLESMVYNDALEPIPPVSVESIPMEIKMEEVQATKDGLAAPHLKTVDEDVPSPGWEPADTNNGGMEEATAKLEKRKEIEECPPPRPPLPCKEPFPTSEIGQVVCGSCRSLLSYAKGAKYVKCTCCQTVSFVLEAHEVGQVYCGGCSVLLMYRFGSSAVKCAGCKFITQITPQNRRPPLSEQGVTLQSQLAQLRPHPTTNLAQ